MLALRPPYLEFDGVSVFSDSANARQYYYMPRQPQLAVDEHNRPAIRLFVYKADLAEAGEDDEHATGFLVFDTDLAWPADTITKVAAKVKSAMKLDEDPILSPLLYREGTVRLVFLDQASVPPGKTPPAGGPATDPGKEWVIHLEASGVPSLYGDNRAIFSVELTKKAAQLTAAAFGGFVPAGVIYDLQFAGLQPAFHVKATVDWSQVYDFVKESWDVGLVFFHSDVEDIVSKLEDKQIIRIEASQEGIGEEGMEGQFNAVRKELTDFIFQKFFKPEPFPDKIDPHNAGDGVIGFLRDLRNGSRPASVGYSRLSLHEEDLRSFEATYDVAKAATRRIVPQAHLSTFFADYDLKYEDIVTIVDGRDSMWRELELRVSCPADFATLGIQAIRGQLAYGPIAADGTPTPEADIWPFELTPAATSASRAAWFDPRVGPKVSYKYDVIFAPASTPGPDLPVAQPWRQSESNLVVLRADNVVQAVTFTAELSDAFPLAEIPEVVATFRYADPEADFHHEHTALLKSSAKQVSVTFRRRRGGPEAVQWTLTYPSHGELAPQVHTTTSDLTVLSDPRADVQDITVIPAGDAEQVIVELRHGRQHRRLRFKGDALQDSQDWSFVPEHDGDHRYEYAETVITTGGEILQTGWVQSESPMLGLGPKNILRWQVRPEVVGPPLNDGGVDRIILDLHYEADGQPAVDVQRQFTATGPGQPIALQLTEPSARDYSYTLRYVLNTGFEQRVGPLDGHTTFLSIPSIPAA